MNESQEEYHAKSVSTSTSSEDNETVVNGTKEKNSQSEKREKKLPKAGEWLKSGKSIIESYDMRAVLK